MTSSVSTRLSNAVSAKSIAFEADSHHDGACCWTILVYPISEL